MVVFIKKENILKALGIFVVVVMALSMAAAVLYVEPNPINDDDTPPEPIGTQYNYTFSFDSNAVKDIGALKAFAFTKVLDKESIDDKVLDINGISKVSSQFKKESTDSGEWIYIAEIAIKRGSNLNQIIADFLDINFFNQEKRSESGALKQITVAAPKDLMIHNVDLNIDKSFSFEMETLPVWANTNTSQGDELTIQGTMVMQNKVIVELSLIEVKNITTDRIIEQLMQQMQDQNAPLDSNSPPIDLNLPLPDLNK